MAEHGRLRQLILAALLGVLLWAAQVLLAVLPNIELVSLLILLYMQLFPRVGIGAVGVFILLEGLLYGFGIWWVNYLYVWPLLAGLAWLMRGERPIALYAALTGGFGLLFGALCAIPYLLLGGPSAAFAYWVAGIPFDMLHCLGNVLATLLLYRPLLRCLQRVRRTL